MPIDLDVALGAELPPVDFDWTESDVLLYHLALGAGADPTDPRELRYATEDDLHVLPTFAVVAPSVHATDPPRVEYPGVSIDLARVLHGSQRIDIHRSLPVSGKARATARVRDIWDKGSAAVVVTETVVCDLDANPLWTNTSTIFARGEGDFGGDRGPSHSSPAPDRAPDHVIVTPTLPQQALWYRLLGDRNPLHSNPGFAARAGFDRPILHGLCTYGMVAKGLVDTMLGGDVTAVRSFEARFAGPVLPGETLRTAVWQQGDGYRLVTTVDERNDASALSGATLEVAG